LRVDVAVDFVLPDFSEGVEVHVAGIQHGFEMIDPPAVVSIALREDVRFHREMNGLESSAALAVSA
jgi:hypothetical protein